MRLYEISDLYLHALDELTNADNGEPLPQEAIDDTLEGIEGTFKEKAAGLAAYILNMEADIAAISDAIEKMEKRHKTLRLRVKSLRAYLKECIVKTGIQVETAEFKVVIQRNPPRVEISDPFRIPEEFKEKITETKILRLAIANALKAGVEVPGAFLAQDTRLVIS